MTLVTRRCGSCGDPDYSPVMPAESTPVPCPNPERCSGATLTECVVFSEATENCEGIPFFQEGEKLTSILLKIKNRLCNVTPITAVAIKALELTGTLDITKEYFITDRGVYITATASDELSTVGIRTMPVVKNTFYVPATGVLGVWRSGLSSAPVDSVAVWGGRCWENLTGSVGTAVDDSTLDVVNWVLIPTTNATYYKDKTFGCTYDNTNSWVASQWDDQGNVMSAPYEESIANFSATINPINITDWGWKYLLRNRAMGIFNNVATKIASNDCTQIIKRNFTIATLDNNIGINISGNTAARISANRTETITNNVCGSIKSNNCISITLCTNTGNISENRCLNILSCANQGNIISNYNLGTISGIGAANTHIQYNGTTTRNITTTTTGIITDTYIDK